MEGSASYRIQSVARMTGVPAATLRAWERRYGFPSPARSSSAYRLFSERDVELVKRMQKLIESGIAPNEAARQLLESVGPAVLAQTDRDPYEEATERIVDAITKLDVGRLQLELRRTLVLENGYTVFAKILRPVLHRVGELWEAGAISVAHEQLASHLITVTILDLMRITGSAADGPTVLLACFADEAHILPLYGAALAVTAWGYRPILLGARTPPGAIARAVEALEPNVVGLSVTIAPEPKSAARELVDAYADACKGTPWVVGGNAAADLAPWVEARGGAIVPSDLDQARKVMDKAAFGRKRRGA